jgi:pyruvate dehydrogenase E2 component (dihydrolipoamide acetyltransferase)
MKLEIRIPDIAENVTSGLIAAVLVSEGDTIEKDQSVVEVETDKAATEIPSPYEGTVEKIKVSEGDEVEVGQVIIVIEGKEGQEEKAVESGEEPESESGEEPESEPVNESAKEPKGKPEEESRKKETGGKGTGGDETGGDETGGDETGKPEDESSSEKEDESSTEPASEDISASPLARRIARESGVEISRIKGSGPSERIMSKDVRAYLEEDEGSLQVATPSGEYIAEPLSNIRKLTADRMSESWQQIPHVTQFDEADITGLEQYRQKVQSRYEKSGTKLTVTSILVKITAFALQRYPKFNASLDPGKKEILFMHGRHVGIAVDTDRGLMVPVIRDADHKALKELTIEMNELAEKARNKKISPDDLQGGTFTISNLGGIGGTAFTPIVYSPQVAILGISRSSYKQVDVDGEFRRRLILPLSLSYDHRVIDGAEGVRFLRWICNALENPYSLLD